jgi:hypothetical protein
MNKKRAVVVLVASTAVIVVALVVRHRSESQTQTIASTHGAPLDSALARTAYESQLNNMGLTYHNVPGKSGLSVCFAILRGQSRGGSYIQPALLVRNDGTECRLSSIEFSAATETSDFKYRVDRMTQRPFKSHTFKQIDHEVVITANSETLVFLSSPLPNVFSQSNSFNAAVAATGPAEIDFVNSALRFSADGEHIEIPGVKWIVAPGEELGLLFLTFAA